jgi:hypothetical protein
MSIKCRVGIRRQDHTPRGGEGAHKFNAIALSQQFRDFNFINVQESSMVGQVSILYMEVFPS